MFCLFFPRCQTKHFGRRNTNHPSSAIMNYDAKSKCTPEKLLMFYMFHFMKTFIDFVNQHTHTHTQWHFEDVFNHSINGFSTITAFSTLGNDENREISRNKVRKSEKFSKNWAFVELDFLFVFWNAFKEYLFQFNSKAKKKLMEKNWNKKQFFQSINSVILMKKFNLYWTASTIWENWRKVKMKRCEKCACRLFANLRCNQWASQMACMHMCVEIRAFFSFSRTLFCLYLEIWIIWPGISHKWSLPFSRSHH